MSYRVYVQPLVEKTENSATNSELIVNIENGYLSVQGNDGKKSSMKDIDGSLEAQKYVLKRLKTIFTSVEAELVSVLQLYSGNNQDMSDLITLLNAIESNITLVHNNIDAISTSVGSSSSIMWEYSSILSQLITSLFQQYSSLTSFERRIEELEQMNAALQSYKSTSTTQITSINSLLDSVENNVNLRASTADFNTWKNQLIASYMNLKNNFSQVESISFTFNN